MLIKCPDCGTEISSEAECCLKCGCPIARKQRNDYRKKLLQTLFPYFYGWKGTIDRKGWWIATIVMLAIIAFFVLIIGGCADDDHAWDTCLSLGFLVARLGSLFIDQKRARDIGIAPAWPIVIHALCYGIMASCSAPHLWLWFSFPLACIIIFFYANLAFSPTAYTPKSFWAKLNPWYAFFKYEGTLNRRQWFCCRLATCALVVFGITVVKTFQDDANRNALSYETEAAIVSGTFPVRSFEHPEMVRWSKEERENRSQEYLQKAKEIRQENLLMTWAATALVNLFVAFFAIGRDVKRLQDIGKSKRVIIPVGILLPIAAVIASTPLVGRLLTGIPMLIYSLYLCFTPGAKKQTEEKTSQG